MTTRVIKSDRLGRVSNDELSRHYEGITQRIRAKKRGGADTSYLEIEACYLYRELEWRKQRVEAHQKYLSEKFSQK